MAPFAGTALNSAIEGLIAEAGHAAKPAAMFHWVELIQHYEVGYMNPFVFSNTFKKWIGWRPSEHRSRMAR